MPWVAVLLALALAEVAAVAPVRDGVARVPWAARVVVVTVAAVALAAVAWNRAASYPTTHSRAALETLVQASAHGPAYIAYQDDPIDLVAPGPIRIVNDRTSLQGYSVAGVGGGLRILHLYPGDVAARELRPACGHTAAIAGFDIQAVEAVLPLVGCRALQRHVDTHGTARVDDDTIVVTFAPAAG